MAKIALIANPNARRNRKKSGWLHAQKATIEHAPGCAYFETHSLEHLRDLLPELVGEFEVLAISGGDGSIHATLTHLYRKNLPVPPIHYIPSGTMNMMATTLRSGKNLAGLERCIQTPLAALPVTLRDTLCINDRYIGFLFGTGLVVNFLAAYYEMGGKGGVDAARLVRNFAVSVVRGTEFAKQLTRAEACEIWLDGNKQDLTSATAILVQTIANLGIGFKPMYRAEGAEGKFHSIITDYGTWGLLNRIGYIYRGRPWNSPHVIDEIAEQARLVFADDTHMQVDGEIYETSAEITLRVHDAVRFV